MRSSSAASARLAGRYPHLECRRCGGGHDGQCQRAQSSLESQPHAHLPVRYHQRQTLPEKEVNELRFSAKMKPMKSLMTAMAGAGLAVGTALLPAAPPAHADAVAYLREQLALSRNDPDFYNLLSISYAALDHKTLQHQATAEMYFLLGAATLALEQLQLAKRAADADFYTMTEIDARLKQVTQVVRDQRDQRLEQGGR